MLEEQREKGKAMETADSPVRHSMRLTTADQAQLLLLLQLLLVEARSWDDGNHITIELEWLLYWNFSAELRLLWQCIEKISTGLRQYQLDNNMDGFYIAPAFMDKLVAHISKNFMNLPNIKVPLILGIWGGKGQGKSFQCELVFAKMGINPIMMNARELESGNAGEPAKLIRQRYREAADIIRKGKMCVLFINDLNAGAGRLGGTTQYTVNNQMFYWAPTGEDRIGACTGIFRSDNVPKEDIVKLVDTFPGQSIDFFGAVRARVYDDQVRKWIAGVGVENVGKKLVNSKEGALTFEQPKMTLEKLLEYGNMLVQEQENALIGGKAAQQVNLPVPEGCTDPSAANFDPTARSDDGSCLYQF
ncbi:hypothetical protein F0562_016294 [Nyssa sinensis]|uniref:Ribulose bisphosphate carboxylase/oxygenase activase, chloroplastic n=1 Tax=Nyssa sinensis TaxID=561372 RepID=A0A5J4ZN69_9ASTE|nr:hypothetical protein F0562_016294 [Nyssa sinensis]